MAFLFDYNGGVVKPTAHSVEKFLLYFVINGREVPFYSLRKDSLVLQPDMNQPHHYSTGNNVMKLFMSEAGFGKARRFYSFYMRMIDSSQTAPVITFKSLSLDPRSTFFLTAKARFLKKSEILGMLNEDQVSRRYVESQTLPPVNLLEKLISVDKSEIRKGVRHLRVGTPKKRR